LENKRLKRICKVYYGLWKRFKRSKNAMNGSELTAENR